MNKIKTLLKSFSEHFTRVMTRYPATMLLILLDSIATAAFIDQSAPFCRFIENKGIPFIMLWGIGVFFSETYWEKNKTAKAAGILAAGGIAAGLIYFADSSSWTVSESVNRWTNAYVLILIALGVYKNYLKSGLRFEQYCIRVVHELARLAIVCGIAAAGIALVMVVFVTLILNGEHFMLVIRAEFLVLGCLAGSGLLDAQIRTDRELPRFFIVIVKYLLMILLLAAFAIIYGYILKIIISQVVPSNEIFRILAGLFILGLPIWTMIGSFEPDHLLVRLGVKLPYIFIPFLFLQGYAIRERILAFGITPLRYLCLALMLFEILYIIVYALRKRETGVMLPVIAVMALICLVMPYVNMYSVSNRSQKAIFDRLTAAEYSGLSADERSDLAGAYYYLTGDPEGEAMLADADPEKIGAIKAGGKTGNRDIDRNMYLKYDFPVNNEDISDFVRMTLVLNKNTAESRTNNDNYDPAAIGIYSLEGEQLLTADLSAFIDQCISAGQIKKTGDPGFPGIVEPDEGKRLLINHVNMTVKADKTISYLLVEAILLERP